MVNLPDTWARKGTVNSKTVDNILAGTGPVKKFEMVELWS